MRINMGPASEVLVKVPLSLPFVYRYIFLVPVEISGGKGIHIAELQDKPHYVTENILKIYFTLFIAAAYLHTIPNST